MIHIVWYFNIFSSCLNRKIVYMPDCLKVSCVNIVVFWLIHILYIVLPCHTGMSHVKIYCLLLVILCAARCLTLQCVATWWVVPWDVEVRRILAVATCCGVPLKCMLLCDMLCCKTVKYTVCCYVIWCAVRWWIIPWIVTCYILPWVAEVYCVGTWDSMLCYCVLNCKHLRRTEE